MTPRRVLLRIKKLRRFLDERIRDAVRARREAEEDEARAQAAGRVEALQEVRDEMVGERLADEDLEPGDGPDGSSGAPEEAAEAEPASG